MDNSCYYATCCYCGRYVFMNNDCCPACGTSQLDSDELDPEDENDSL